MTVLMVPSINADGRAHNTRGNTTGQDLNRDHALIEQNETKGFALMIRDYTPDVMVDNHEGDSEDLPILGARHLNVEQSLFDEGKLMVNEWMYGAAVAVGLVDGPVQHRRRQPRGHPAQHRARSRTASACSARRAAGAARRGRRRAAQNSRANENRKVYAHLWENWEGMRYINGRMPQIQAAIAKSVAFQTGNIVGRRTVLRGAYPWPSVPWVGEDPNDQPDVDTPLPSRILDPAPCGYFIPQAEYTMARGAFGSVDAAPGDPRHQDRAAGRRRARAAAAAVRRPGRADPRLRGGAADDRRPRSAGTLPEGRPAGRRHRPGDALADARRAGDVRRVHAGHREGLHGLDDRHGHLDRR